MNVTIEPITAKVIGSGRIIQPKIWRIRLDGRHIGTVSTKPGSRIGLTTRFTPDQQEQIQKKVDELTKSKSVGIDQAPHVPEEVRAELRNEATQGMTDDDIDA